MLFQDIEHNIILSIKEESKVIFKTLNISEKVFLLIFFPKKPLVSFINLSRTFSEDFIICFFF
ncbi:hypothetical protein HMPREF3109_05035 [Staphylococcus sp. HMSC10B09]|nr:hypothetical protein HMPREF3109_05035 [Staphylococcus sp. HMSC10B09]